MLLKLPNILDTYMNILYLLISVSEFTITIIIIILIIIIHAILNMHLACPRKTNILHICQ